MVGIKVNIAKFRLYIISTFFISQLYSNYFSPLKSMYHVYGKRKKKEEEEERKKEKKAVVEILTD